MFAIVRLDAGLNLSHCLRVMLLFNGKVRHVLKRALTECSF